LPEVNKDDIEGQPFSEEPSTRQMSLYDYHQPQQPQIVLEMKLR